MSVLQLEAPAVASHITQVWAQVTHCSARDKVQRKRSCRQGAGAGGRRQALKEKSSRAEPRVLRRWRPSRPGPLLTPSCPRFDHIHQCPLSTAMPLSPSRLPFFILDQCPCKALPCPKHPPPSVCILGQCAPVRGCLALITQHLPFSTPDQCPCKALPCSNYPPPSFLHP